MKYHDNEVCLPVSSYSGYKLLKGSFLVNEYSVSKGEDPDGNIYIGLKKEFGSNGKFSFRVGRHGSKDVAAWFKSRIAASQTTFNHDPGKLNFAFIGTLSLTVSGGILGDNERTFVFNDIAIAQGHSGAMNNWWFGGKHCKYVGSDTVVGEGRCEDGINFPFNFLRGGNSVNTVNITPKGLANWMGNLSDHAKLSELMLPGSHDAGMSDLSHCFPFAVSDKYTKTQSLSLGKQLENGARYFDIRVDYDYGDLVTYHRSGALGCNGQKLKSVLNETIAFLSKNKGEFCILKFSHIRDYGDNHKPKETKEKIEKLLNDYQDYMFVDSNAKLNLYDVKLAQVRGKMILVFDYNEYIDTSAGRFRYKDGSSFKADSNLTVYDKYSNTANYSKMKEDQLEKWEKYAKPDSGYLFLLSWTLTSNKPPFSGLPPYTASIVDLAKKANSHLPEVLHEQIAQKKWQKPNVVYIDYVNQTTNQAIVSYNFDGVLALNEKHKAELQLH